MGQFIEAHDRLRNCGKPTDGAGATACASAAATSSTWPATWPSPADDSIFRHVGLQHGSVPAGGATQWLPMIIGDRRAREMIMLCEDDPRGQGARVGPRSTASCRAPSSTRRSTSSVEKLAARLPEATRYAKHQLNFWRDLAWHQTVGHARDWLTLHAGDAETREAVERVPREAPGRPRAHPPGRAVSDDARPRRAPRAPSALLTLNRPSAERALGRPDGRARRRADELEADDGACARSCSTGAGAGVRRGRRHRRDGRRHAPSTCSPATGSQRWERVRRFAQAADRGRRTASASAAAASSRMTCDIVIAAEDARSASPRRTSGIIPGAGGTQRTDARAGQVADDGDGARRALPDAARGAAARASAPASSPARRCSTRPLAVAAADRRALARRHPPGARGRRRGVRDDPRGGPRAYERRSLYLAFASEDAHEGMRAFLEKRAAEWKGRERERHRDRDRARRARGRRRDARPEPARRP